jgi:hypothetical protein
VISTQNSALRENKSYNLIAARSKWDKIPTETVFKDRVFAQSRHPGRAAAIPTRKSAGKRDWLDWQKPKPIIINDKAEAAIIELRHAN